MRGLSLSDPAFVGGLGGGAAFRYHRLYITNHGGDNNVGVAELILREVAGGAQVAIGGVCDASGQASSTYDCSKAFDGDSATAWITPWGGGPQWLSYDLGAGEGAELVEYAIRLTTIWVQRAPRSWELQGSNDGSTWETLDSRSWVVWERAGEIQTFTI